MKQGLVFYVFMCVSVIHFTTPTSKTRNDHPVSRLENHVRNKVTDVEITNEIDTLEKALDGDNDVELSAETEHLIRTLLETHRREKNQKKNAGWWFGECIPCQLRRQRPNIKR